MSSNHSNGSNSSNCDVVKEGDDEWELENWNDEDRNESKGVSDGRCVNPYVKGLMEKSGLKLLQKRKAKNAFGDKKKELGLFLFVLDADILGHHEDMDEY